MSAQLFRGDAGEVLRQASAVVGRPVILWEVTGAHAAVPRATSHPDLSTPLPSFDLDATLRRWKVPIPVGSRWVTAPGATPDAWVIAPVRSHPPAPPPGGRERRSRDRLALELTGLALGAIDPAPVATEFAAGSARGDALQELATSPAMIAHEASNPLTAARVGLQLAMESIGRWVDLAADRRLALLDDLGQVIEDIDRATGFLRAVQDRARGAQARSERFDAVRVVRSCLTLERRLLRDRGIDLDFTTSLDAMYLKGDPNALFDLLVNLVRNAADATAQAPAPVEVRLGQKGRDLEVIVRDRGTGIPAQNLSRIFEPGFTSKEFGKGSGMGLAKVRSVAEAMFGGSVRVESQPGKGTTFTISLPLPPQRDSDPSRGEARGETVPPSPSPSAP
ncbi:MAG TPA: ATP-binding protein [Gemmatimonadales bacterium]|nr:ATP-binding protein [Gemmatimonadales bacterium]